LLIQSQGILIFSYRRIWWSTISGHFAQVDQSFVLKDRMNPDLHTPAQNIISYMFWGVAYGMFWYILEHFSLIFDHRSSFFPVFSTFVKKSFKNRLLTARARYVRVLKQSSKNFARYVLTLCIQAVPTILWTITKRQGSSRMIYDDLWRRDIDDIDICFESSERMLNIYSDDFFLTGTGSLS